MDWLLSQSLVMDMSVFLGYFIANALILHEQVRNTQRGTRLL